MVVSIRKSLRFSVEVYLASGISTKHVKIGRNKVFMYVAELTVSID